MEINPQVKAILKGNKIDETKGLLYLLALHFKLNPIGVIPEEDMRRIILCRIIEKDHLSNSIKWNYPLFAGTEAGAFDWCVEWMHSFSQIGNQRITPSSTAIVIRRMREWFSKNPEYRKEDVFAARDLYFRTERPSSKFVKTSYKFIQEGDVSMLLMWCERAKELKNTSTANPLFKGKMM